MDIREGELLGSRVVIELNGNGIKDHGIKEIRMRVVDLQTRESNEGYVEIVKVGGYDREYNNHDVRGDDIERIRLE